VKATAERIECPVAFVGNMASIRVTALPGGCRAQRDAHDLARLP
jgi:hypothetical protein